MAKVGYIMATSQYDKLEEDRKWMNEFGCVRIIGIFFFISCFGLIQSRYFQDFSSQ